MSNGIGKGHTNYKSGMEFLDAYLRDGGQIIDRGCVFLPPPSWPADEHEKETGFWGTMVFAILDSQTRMEHHKLLTNTCSIDAAASFLNPSNNQVRQLCKDGAFGAIKFGTTWRIYKPSLQRYPET